MPGYAKVLVRNRLIAALPSSEVKKLLGVMEPVEVVFGDLLYEAGERIKHVYFPETALVSLLTSVDPQHAAEVGLVGAEGMIGVPVALGMAVSPFLAVVQGPGVAWRLSTANFKREFAASEALRSELFRFTYALMTQVAQTAACNRFHVVTQRLARWLLMTRDRAKTNEFTLTQEFLARMLGVRRVGVTAAAGILQKQNLIRYSRGTITIVDPKGLAHEACGCYEQVKAISRHSKA